MFVALAACGGTDARTLFVSTTCDSPGLARSIAASGHHAWVTEEEASKVHRFDLTTCGVDQEWQLLAGPRSIALLPSGDFATANEAASAIQLGHPDGGTDALIISGQPTAIAAGTLEGAIELVTTIGLDPADAGWGRWSTAPLAQLDLEPSSGASAVGIADVDGDGRNEVLIARSTEHRITVVTPGGTSVDSSACPEPFALAALPGHGAVITCRTGGVVTLEGTTLQTLLRDGTLYQTAAEDFDADGFADLASVDPFAHKLVLWWGAKDGFTTPVELTIPDGPVALAVTDFDSDGDPDIIVLSLMAKKLAVVENPLRGKSR